jgi:hypothetical protein
LLLLLLLLLLLWEALPHEFFSHIQVRWQVLLLKFAEVPIWLLQQQLASAQQHQQAHASKHSMWLQQLLRDKADWLTGC